MNSRSHLAFSYSKDGYLLTEAWLRSRRGACGGKIGVRHPSIRVPGPGRARRPERPAGRSLGRRTLRPRRTPQSFGGVEGDFDRQALVFEVVGLPGLAYRRDLTEPEVTEQAEQLLERLFPLGERDFDLLTRLGGAAQAGAFVGDPVGRTDPTNPKGFVGLGEVARGCAR